MKYNDNGTYKDIYVKAFDTLPVGAIVEYSGSTIPDGWTDIGNNQIQKTSQYIEGGAGLPSYFTNEIDTGMKWIDGKPLYRKVVNGSVPTTSSNGTDVTSGIFVNNDIDTMIIEFAYIKMGSPDQRSRQLPFITTSGYRIAVTTKCDINGGQSSELAPYNYLGVSNNYANYSGKNLVASILYTKTTD